MRSAEEVSRRPAPNLTPPAARSSLWPARVQRVARHRGQPASGPVLARSLLATRRVPTRRPRRRGCVLAPGQRAARGPLAGRTSLLPGLGAPRPSAPARTGVGVESPRKRHDPRPVAGVLLAGWLRAGAGPESRAGAGVAAVESGLGAAGGLRLSTTLRGFLTTTMRRRSVSARAPSAPGRSADAVGCAALGGSGLRLMRVALGLRRSSESWRSGVAVGLSSLMLSYAGRSIRESTSPCQSTAGTSVC